MRTDTSPYLLHCLDGPSVINDDLPDGYAFRVWTPTMRHPRPATMGLSSAAWTLFHYCGLFASEGYCTVYIVHGERIVHRSCVLPRYFRWPFMGEDDLQISSTWTAPEFRGKGLASLALAHIVRTMPAARRRFWYVTRESNIPSIRVCRRVGFKLLSYGTRGATLGFRCLGQLKQVEEAATWGLQDGQALGPVQRVTRWYARYYARMGSDRNDLRVNRGVLFQTMASERSVIRAFYRIPLELSRLRVLDVGCGGAGGWYQLFRLGVTPQKTAGIDLQLDRLVHIGNLYPQCTAINADGTRMPFASTSFDLVYESTMLATLSRDSVRADIAAEMLRVCRPNGYLLLVDWRITNPVDQNFKALTRAEVKRLFGVGKTTSLVGTFPGALLPQPGRLLSTYAGPLYFLIAGLCPPLVGQVAYLLRKLPDPECKP